MKITKFEHACLLVEMPDPTNRTALFDPGVMSEAALDVSKLTYLDDIIITHSHADHLSMSLMHELTKKFSTVRITAPAEVISMLQAENMVASTDETDGIEFFIAPHENVKPLFPIPQQIGVHYLDTLTHPGDSHSFTETKAVLALPIAGPWASMITAVNLAIKLRPEYVLPIHDWHLSREARSQMYDLLSSALKKENIQFMPLQTGEPVVITP